MQGKLLETDICDEERFTQLEAYNLEIFGLVLGHKAFKLHQKHYCSLCSFVLQCQFSATKQVTLILVPMILSFLFCRWACLHSSLQFVLSFRWLAHCWRVMLEDTWSHFSCVKNLSLQKFVNVVILLMPANTALWELNLKESATVPC